jgi:hypothetical protein
MRMISEYFEFLTQHKKWWILPIVILLLLVGAILVSTQSSPLAPLIYTIF